jgi:hypothetical protein
VVKAKEKILRREAGEQILGMLARPPSESFY